MSNPESTSETSAPSPTSPSPSSDTSPAITPSAEHQESPSPSPLTPASGTADPSMGSIVAGGTPTKPHTSAAPAQGSAAPSTKTTEKKPASETKYTSVQGVGVCSDRNARYRRTMEDAHVILDGFGGIPNQGYFAIYDGHGGRGAVEFVAKTLHENILKELTVEANATDALKKAYLYTDKQIGENNIQYSGTTTISALLQTKPNGERWLYTANVGDARAVLCRSGKAKRLSYDHKGSDEAEAKRIVDAGGFMVLNRVNGVLAVTRSLGDCAMKDYVTGDPYTTETLLQPGDTHLILACDGVWDVISDQDALELIQSETDPQRMSEKLLVQALRNGSTDNISVVIVVL